MKLDIIKATNLPTLASDIGGKVIEEFDLYKGHLYAVTFSVLGRHRCGYVLLNQDDPDDDTIYDVVNSVSVTLLDESSEHLFPNSRLGSNHRLLGWDYASTAYKPDAETTSKLLTGAAEAVIGSGVEEDVCELKGIMEIALILKYEDVEIAKLFPNTSERKLEPATVADVIKDCRVVIDELENYKNE